MEMEINLFVLETDNATKCFDCASDNTSQKVKLFQRISLHDASTIYVKNENKGGSNDSNRCKKSTFLSYRAIKWSVLVVVQGANIAKKSETCTSLGSHAHLSSFPIHRETLTTHLVGRNINNLSTLRQLHFVQC